MSSDLLLAYARQGYVISSDVLGEPEVGACLRHLDVLSDAHPPPPPAILTASLEADQFLADLAADTRLTRMAKMTLGEQPEPFGVTFITKEAEHGLPVHWHQDGYPWRERLGIRCAVTLWIALDRMDRDNGGLEVVPGSHLLDAQPLQPSTDEPNIFGVAIEPTLVDVGRARALEMEPGDVSAHHPHLIHGSGPNRSGRPRRAVAIRYRPKR